jgi:phosphatidylinositol kinase/protein kinase (PI-3  family)
LHIDFGDCFEVAMNREKFPERVPFRLTRMLIKAMEVSGIEGSYRSTCEKTLNVLRDNQDSLVAMLEAFVYDPLISWRLADLSQSDLPSQNSEVLVPVAEATRQQSSPSEELRDPNVPMGVPLRTPLVNPITEGEESDDGEGQADPLPAGLFDQIPSVSMAQMQEGGTANDANRTRSHIYAEMQSLAANRNIDSRIASVTGAMSAAVQNSIAHSRLERSMKQREFMSLLGGEQGAAHEEALNEKALKVIRRVEDKLTGTDFPDCAGDPLDVADQVQRLIVQATSTESLCQLYIGWCSFW